MAKVYKRVELQAAIIAGYDPEMDKVAAKLEATAKALAPVETSRYRDSIKTRKVMTRRGVMDREVVADDPRARDIEYGGLDTKSDENNPRFIPGHYTMTRASEIVRGGR
ncbi:DUF5403 family protein [Rothia sp. P4278]|uniref:DUF5403 family protein n=1 Tax=Rothia sp. P4278 TaxID=3402658 RepID=UPI003AE8D3EE